MQRLAPEQHDTLDNIPEPAENAALVGHDSAARAIASAYASDKLPSGIMLVGLRGIGKATFAFHLANHLLRFSSPASAPPALSAPDAGSALFRQIASGAHPGVLHLTRPMNDRTNSFKSALTVDEIRRISRFLSMTSHDGGYRIVIVDPADDMNTNAANALLKNLEEPPARTVFVLIVNSPGSILATIRSRCQVFRLEPLRDNELSQALTSIGSDAPEAPEELSALHQRAHGSVRQALLLTHYGGIEIAQTIDRLAGEGRFSTRDAYQLADVVARKDSAMQFELFNDHVLDLLAAAAQRAGQTGDLSSARRLAKSWNEARMAIAETQSYNLDRKQHALNMISRLNDAFRM